MCAESAPNGIYAFIELLLFSITFACNTFAYQSILFIVKSLHFTHTRFCSFRTEFGFIYLISSRNSALKWADEFESLKSNQKFTSKYSTFLKLNLKWIFATKVFHFFWLCIIFRMSFTSRFLIFAHPKWICLVFNTSSKKNPLIVSNGYKNINLWSCNNDSCAFFP